MSDEAEYLKANGEVKLSDEILVAVYFDYESNLSGMIFEKPY